MPGRVMPGRVMPGRVMLGRLALGAAGLALIGIAIHGILGHPRDTLPRRWATWLVGSALVHDLLLAPTIALAGFLVVRFVPKAARAAVQAGLIVTGAVLAVGLVAVFGAGKQNYPDNRSLLPLPYARNLLLVLASVWVVTLVCASVAVVRARRKG